MGMSRPGTQALDRHGITSREEDEEDDDLGLVTDELVHQVAVQAVRSP